MYLCTNYSSREIRLKKYVCEFIMGNAPCSLLEPFHIYLSIYENSMQNRKTSHVETFIAHAAQLLKTVPYD